MSGETDTATRRILHVGCGRKRKEHLPAAFQGSGWQEVRLDISDTVEPDIVADITDMSMIEDGSFDALYSSHNIEHLYAHQVPVALAEFARVLRPGSGVAVITCPDLQALGEALAAGNLTTPLYHSPVGPVAPIDILYGFRPSIAAGAHYMAHKTGFTGQALVNQMFRAGFEDSIGMRQPGRYALWAIGFRWKPSDEEKREARRRYFPR